jgi:hypothetical protein
MQSSASKEGPEHQGLDNRVFFLFIFKTSNYL